MDQLKQDLKLSRRTYNLQTSDREFVDLSPSTNRDLMTVSGRENLAQAITNRLLTRKGELKRLGHPNYGSRMYLLVGELNNLRTRAKAEMYIRECLKQEFRIKEIVEIRFDAPTRDASRTTLKTYITVKPIDEERNLSIALALPL